MFSFQLVIVFFLIKGFLVGVCITQARARQGAGMDALTVWKTREGRRSAFVLVVGFFFFFLIARWFGDGMSGTK